MTPLRCSSIIRIMVEARGALAIKGKLKRGKKATLENLAAGVMTPFGETTIRYRTSSVGPQSVKTQSARKRCIGR